MRRAFVLLLGLAACDRVLGISKLHGDGGGGGDDGGGGQDSDGMDSGSQVCLGTAPQICVNEPDTDLVLSGSIDTGVDTRCIVVSQGGPKPDLCVLAAHSIDVDAFAGSGDRPLVLFATQRIVIHSTLSVASTFSGIRGAGSSPACAVGTPPGAVMSMSGGGGAGGSSAGMGGAGGATSSGTVAGGQAGPPSSPTAILGGCNGQDGGDIGGTHGIGGGALYLLAGATITTDPNGTINASGGSGGAASTSVGGGGGGGSGGLIVFSAPSGTIDGQVFARGGAGGGGGAPNSVHGTDPTSTTLGGLGGGAGTAGGAGGPGCYSASDSGGPGKPGQTGGGGGGGGCGRIRVDGQIAFAIQPVPAPN